MKIALITPTCRESPRLVEVSRTIAAALRHAGDVELKWIIVDEKGRGAEQLVDLACELDVEVTLPFPSPHRDGGPEKGPAHNSARGKGLALALTWGAEYVALLNDCNVVTYGMISVLRDCAAQGVGYRAKMHEVHDLAIPNDGRVIFRDHHDLLRPIPVKTACGALWGAPAWAFDKCRGFDLSYDGQRYGNDLDMVIRLNRAGINFVTTERAFVIQMRRTKNAQEITTRKDAIKGDRNRKLINQLGLEKQRFTPLWIAGEDAPTPVEVAAPAAPVEAPPKPAWKKRAPPVVGAGIRHARQNQTAIKPAPARPAPAAPARPVGKPGVVAAAAPIPTPPAAPPGNANDIDLSDVDQIDDTPPEDEFDGVMTPNPDGDDAGELDELTS